MFLTFPNLFKKITKTKIQTPDLKIVAILNNYHNFSLITKIIAYTAGKFHVVRSIIVRYTIRIIRKKSGLFCSQKEKCNPKTVILVP
ncbi:MAG: hypothetical protein BGO42_08495 [Flavobacterium sp. 40-81]|nr:MAG: hypothetical protein ABS44_16040 [Chryseobacterium sp. SCN 40-13]OJV70604.1 MAG: hypothetical protein BGO42_08495 [Flavobacterium sp. 40-81]